MMARATLNGSAGRVVEREPPVAQPYLKALPLGFDILCIWNLKMTYSKISHENPEMKFLFR